MTKRTFVRAEEGKPPGISVVYYDTDGNQTIRYHDKNGKIGSDAWRNNNPGNLVYGDGTHAKETGGIGKAKKRTVFPDYDTGKQSMRLLLKKDFYQKLTLNELPRKYTGVKPGVPDTEEVIHYRKAIRVQTKFDMERTVKSLNEEEYEKLLKAMETHEGWLVGHEEFKVVEKITGIRMNKKRVISEYLVQGMKGERWLLKDAAIVMAEEGRLHAIVVHGKNGSYLRPEHGSRSFRELLC
jgi:hypothetical protein